MESVSGTAATVQKDLEELDRAACFELLASMDLGRIAWSDAGRVMVFPLNIALDGERIVFRSASASIASAVASDQLLSIQTDDVEPALKTGWSVLAIGPASEVNDPAEVHRLSRLVTPWRNLSNVPLMTLSIQLISGRRLPTRDGVIETVYIGLES